MFNTCRMSSSNLLPCSSKQGSIRSTKCRTADEERNNPGHRSEGTIGKRLCDKKQQTFNLWSEHFVSHWFKMSDAYVKTQTLCPLQSQLISTLDVILKCTNPKLLANNIHLSLFTEHSQKYLIGSNEQT